MYNMPHKIEGITHALVSEMYLKREFRDDNTQQDVLVIDARPCENNKNGHGDFDSYLLDLLVDLDDLKSQVERKAGSFDRVDIRTH
ncbi:MAG: hypothetical protein IT559_08735 [Alphaproteobacteria bacterium]|nr:hypothetical protein [Alphaproteobacteria bacterium]